MTLSRLLTIFIIFCFVTTAWFFLGFNITKRTQSGYQKIGKEVQQLWGSPHIQKAPKVNFIIADNSVNSELESSNIDLGINLQHRRKGLLWYSTYDVDFEGVYTFINPYDEPVMAQVTFDFPSSQTIYDDFEYMVENIEVIPKGSLREGLETVVQIPSGEEGIIHIAYKSRGLDSWKYSFADNIITVKNFSLNLISNLNEYNFPAGTISASTKTKSKNGWALIWEFDKMVSDFDVGIEMPNRKNPGPLVSRMSYFAPISLMFYFIVLIVIGAMKRNSLHPVHYLFLAASFFSFHILFSYLIDHLLIELSFLLAAGVSMGLAVSYLWQIMGKRFALRVACTSQFLFLILFSFAFFFEGYTGLVVTLGAIITLTLLMQITAKVNWDYIINEKQVSKTFLHRKTT